MKNIWKKLWKLIGGNKVVIFVIILLLVLSGVIYIQNKRIQHWKESYQSEVNLNDALNDTINWYQNKHKEWVAEKQTIQSTLKRLEELNGKLTDNQKELLARIKESEKNYTIIAAALIQTNAKIDSLLDKDAGGVVVIDTTNKKLNFNNLASSDSTFKYDIDVNHAIPAHLDIRPTMLFKSIQFPNEQFVNFYWKNDKKKGYPVMFSVSNSNKYFKTVNLDSYIIPNIDKKHINPTGWQKFENFLFKNGKTLLYVGVGAAGGAGAYWIITK
jgi:hypothetical protein